MIVDQLVSIYKEKLPPNPIMLNYLEAKEYFERLLMQGNIITYVIDGELYGFIEFWRVDFSQFGRLCCNWTLTHDEDLLTGNIALITRMWIDPEKRNDEAFQILSAMFLSRNKDAEHFATFQRHKNHKPLQVYTRDELMKHFK